MKAGSVILPTKGRKSSLKKNSDALSFNLNTLYQVTYFYMNETTILQVVETAQKPEDLETIKQVLSAAK